MGVALSLVAQAMVVDAQAVPVTEQVSWYKP